MILLLEQGTLRFSFKEFPSRHHFIKKIHLCKDRIAPGKRFRIFTFFYQNVVSSDDIKQQIAYLSYKNTNLASISSGHEMVLKGT